jgi:hypothetical protein
MSNKRFSVLFVESLLIQLLLHATRINLLPVLSSPHGGHILRSKRVHVLLEGLLLLLLVEHVVLNESLIDQSNIVLRRHLLHEWDELLLSACHQLLLVLSLLIELLLLLLSELLLLLSEQLLLLLLLQLLLLEKVLLVNFGSVGNLY